MPTFLERVRGAVDGFFGAGAAPGSTWSSTAQPTPAWPTPSDDRPPQQDQSGLPEALTRPAAGASPIVDKYPTILGPLMSPPAVSSALRLGERGYMRRLSDLLSEIREKWPHLHSVLGRAEKSVGAAGWTMSPADTTGMGKRAASRAGQIADRVERRLRALDDLDDHLVHLCGGTYFGRSACETEYFRDRNGIGIAALHSVHPKRLSYAANWRIHLYDEAGNDVRPELGFYPGIDIRDTWPGRFIVHEPREIGAELPTRQGIGRVLVWAGMFWIWSTRDWMEYAELFGKPWRVGTYPKDANDEDIANLKNAMLSLSGLTTAVFREGCKPYFLDPGRAPSTLHTDLVAMWNAEASKVVSGGTLQTEIRGDSGNRALGEVHERGEQALNAARGRWLSSTVTRDLVRELVRLNEGDEAAATFCPVFRLKTDPPVDRDKEAARVQAFIDRGGAVDADEYRDQFLPGMTKPKPGASLLQPAGKVGGIAMSDTATDASGDAAATTTPGAPPKADDEDESDPASGDDDDGEEPKED